MKSIASQLCLLIVALTSLHCSQAQIRGEVNDSSSQLASDQSSADAKTPIIQPEDPVASPAQEPVMVAGGFLYCGVTADEQWDSLRDEDDVIAVVDCFMGDADRRPVATPSPQDARFATVNAAGELVDVSAIVTTVGGVTHWLVPMTTFATPWIMRATLGDGREFECDIDLGTFQPNDDTAE